MKSFKYSFGYMVIIILFPIVAFLLNEFIYNKFLYPILILALVGLYLLSFGGIVALLSRKKLINTFDFWIALLLGSVIVMMPVVYLISAFLS